MLAILRELCVGRGGSSKDVVVSHIHFENFANRKMALVRKSGLLKSFVFEMILWDKQNGIVQIWAKIVTNFSLSVGRGD